MRFRELIKILMSMLCLSLVPAVSPAVASEEKYFCETSYAGLGQNSSRGATSEIKRMGSVSLVPHWYGDSYVTHFDQNWQYSPFSNFPDFLLNPMFEELKPGYSFLGPDGLRWNFESIDEYGVVKFRSGSKTLDWQSGYKKANSYSVISEHTKHKFELVIPALKDGSPDREKLKKIVELLPELPVTGIENLKMVRVNTHRNVWDSYWGEKYRHPLVPNFISKRMFVSAATGGRGTIDIYPAGLSGGLLDTLRHELGHLIAEGKYGSTMPDAVWKQAMKEDGVAVSSYAKKSEAEDFAETVAAYLQTEAGLSEKKWIFSYSHQKFSARFKILDEYFRLNPKEKRRIQAELLRFKRLKVGGTTALFIVGVGGGGKLFLSDEK